MKRFADMWLRNNVRSLLALVFVASSILIYGLTLWIPITIENTIVHHIIDTMGNIDLVILGYYFGASKGINTKTENTNGNSSTNTD